MPPENRRRRSHKDIFIAFMSNTDIQRELLMETRTPLQVLQLALNRERGQENQKAINTQLNRGTPIPLNQISYIQRNQTPSQTPLPRITTWNPKPQRNDTPANQCRRCGLQFIPEHLQVCPPKRVQCNLCKKVGHYSNVCRSAQFLLQTQQITPQKNLPQVRRVRNTRATTNTQSIPNTSQDAQSYKNDEPLDLKNTFFIQEIFDNWNTVNFIKPKSFNNENPAKHSPKLSDKIWIRTTWYQTEIDWLADKGSPRSFVSKEEADRILQSCKTSKCKHPKDSFTKYRCFNNFEIPIT